MPDKKGNPKRAGRPPHVPTQELRDTVIRMVDEDYGIQDIADTCGINRETLHKYYSDLLPPTRRTHVRTAQSALDVEHYLAMGEPPHRVAQIMAISLVVLRHHYADKLAQRGATTRLEYLRRLMLAARRGDVRAACAVLNRIGLPEQRSTDAGGVASLSDEEQAVVTEIRRVIVDGPEAANDSDAA